MTSGTCARADHGMSILIFKPLKKQGVNIAVITYIHSELMIKCSELLSISCYITVF